MKFFTAILIALNFLFSAKTFAAEKFIYRPAEIVPPAIPREFRGAWITCVASNADWPSQPGLSVAQQKAELISLLDRAQQLHLNAIIFQVRPASDAMYASSIEPWSENLTGVQGKSPQPFYDPLAFAIQEAHKRGLELHAWFNPFRAWHPLSKSTPAPNHISQTHPEWIRKYGAQTWIDPGEPAARAYVLSVVMDVVKRYDVDGVQFDDYFYPYPEKSAAGRVLEFSDLATWKKFGEPKNLPREEWRRANINQFIYGVYQNIKAEKPWVKFGVSPFGIWRPGFPPQIRGLDAFANLYADSRLWLASGWLDYFAPQLYWPSAAPQQSFPVLLNWWESQNVKGRNLFAGIDVAKFSADEILRQIQFTRSQNGAGGEIYFHLNNILDNPQLNNLIREKNEAMALPPPMTWLNSFSPPVAPQISATNTPANVAVRWELADGQMPNFWLLQFSGTNNLWTTQIYPADETSCAFSKSLPEIICVSAVDRFGNIGPAAAVKKFRRAREIIYMK